MGAVSVPIYDTDSAPQAQRIMNDSAVKLAFADNRERFDRLDSVKDHCPALKQILMIEGNALGALEGLGVAVSDEELNERVSTVRADDLATIVYTSGSTGNPKGAELTHKNFVSITISASQALHEVVLDDHPRLLLFLPLAHCFARFIQYASIASDDGVVGYLPDTKTLLPDLRSFEPTYLLGVPRVFEKVYNAASHKAGAGWKGRLFVKAAEAARVWSRKEQAGEQHTFAEIAERAKYETLVYRTVRGALGPKIKYVACGGAPLSLDLAHFYNGIGLPMIQGYGMTETAAPFAATRVTDNVIGTVGQPAPAPRFAFPTKANCRSRARTCSAATTICRRRRPRRSPPTAGSGPATWPRSMMRATSSSPAASRTLLLLPAARTSPPFRWRKRSPSARSWSTAWWWATSARSSARW